MILPPNHWFCLNTYANDASIEVILIIINLHKESKSFVEFVTQYNVC